MFQLIKAHLELNHKYLNVFEENPHGVDQGDDPLTHFALFSNCDPTIFEVAVKEPKWRKAIDAEITIIKEMIHGSYVIFQKGKR